MNIVKESFYQDHEIKLKYYEIQNNFQPLVLLHAQGVDASSFDCVWGKLAQKYHIYAVDCYGHGGSLHEDSLYNVEAMGNALIRFIENIVQQKVFLLGHSSGGLITAYVASHTDLCRCLILEDPPFFSSQGERRKTTYNYVDLSTVCHNFINQTQYQDFVLYYFCNQYAWNFFPENSRQKIKEKMTALAAKNRKKHPNKDLKVPFWPKNALKGFQGMNQYDPLFGESFYTDRFHAGISHEELLKNIQCKTIFMKAKTSFSDEGILMAALSESDLDKVSELIADFHIVRFDCGHGIHIEKKKQFIQCLIELAS